MKKSLLLVILVIVAGFACFQRSALLSRDTSPAAAAPAESTLAQAFRGRAGNVRVQGQGTVTKVLPDDTEGTRHQRFILRLDSGQTVMIAHNIDLAPKVDALHKGDAVEFSGEYECNPQGGVIHWTHHDPSGRHPAGWLRHNGTTYR